VVKVLIGQLYFVMFKIKAQRRNFVANNKIGLASGCRDNIFPGDKMPGSDRSLPFMASSRPMTSKVDASRVV